MKENVTEGGFKFRSYLISESLINITNCEDIGKDLSLNVDLDAEVVETDSMVSLTVDIHDEAKNLKIHVKIKGYFESKEVEENSRKRFTALNAPAILFPYVRAYISSLTGQSGIRPLILPTVNLHSHGEKLLQKLDLK